MANTPFFSVIIPTRDRPELFELALNSVLEQDFEHFEVHVVNDGSSGQFLDAYHAIEKKCGDKAHFHYIHHRPNGHGQSYSMNYGADQAQGQYLCFLDDDDFWTDLNYLTKTAASLQNHAKTIDTHYSNQKAFYADGTQNTNNVWIEDLSKILPTSSPDLQGAYDVDTAFLLRSKSFAHLNCSVFRREFYHKIKGMDENIRYECDRDIYIRAIDQASAILYNPQFMSKHHIPDPKKSGNMSTAINVYQKKIYQLNVYEKNILLSKRSDVIKFCLRAKGSELKHVAEALNKEQRHQEAASYAKQALATYPTFKWFGFTILLTFKALFH